MLWCGVCWCDVLSSAAYRGTVPYCLPFCLPYIHTLLSAPLCPSPSRHSHISLLTFVSSPLPPLHTLILSPSPRAPLSSPPQSPKRLRSQEVISLPSCRCPTRLHLAEGVSLRPFSDFMGITIFGDSPFPSSLHLVAQFLYAIHGDV